MSSLRLNKTLSNMFLDICYPIGSIYLSVSDTSPQSIYGGTWEQISKGRTLVGVDPNDNDFKSPKKIGGSKFLQDHFHYGIFNSNGNERKGGYGQDEHTGILSETAGTVFDTLTTGNVNKNVQTGNSGNLQPYFTCYIWCRIA